MKTIRILRNDNYVTLPVSIVLICGFCLLFPILLHTQVYHLGLELDDDSYQEIPHTAESFSVKSGQKAIPSQVDLSSFCPEIRHQGDISSCVGWSTGYAAMTIERAIREGWKNKSQITANAHSAMFVYNQLSDEKCGAIRMPDALRFLQTTGNCLAREFDHDVNTCSRKATEPLIKKAAEYRIEEFIRLFELNATAEDKIKNTRLVLAQSKPVIVGMKVLNNFYSIRYGDESWFPTIGDQTYAGGHAMVVVGYDDNKFHQDRSDVPANQRGAFKIMNSWGKNWGQDGFIWVRYAHFGEYCRHAYALMLEGNKPIDLNADASTVVEIREKPETRDLKSLSGTFGFGLFTNQWFNNKPVFQEQKVKLVDNYYLLNNRLPGDQFQLFIRSELVNGYIYVFSIDATGKMEVHFPKSEEYNIKFSEQNESALLLGSGNSITIPSPESVLTLAHRGEDHLVVLYSESKIKPAYLDFLGEKLSQSGGNIEKKLPSLIEKYMVPFSDITYTRDKMGFIADTRSEGKIVPIILKVVAE